jgi:uncharacterized membrane protein
VNRAERWASRVLLAGGLLGVALMIVGVIGSALWPAHAADTIVSLHQIVQALSHRPRDPLAVSALGIVALFVTPLAAVATAGVAFALEGDRRFVVISAIVVAMLVLSLWLGGA